MESARLRGGDFCAVAGAAPMANLECSSTAPMARRLANLYAGSREGLPRDRFRRRRSRLPLRAGRHRQRATENVVYMLEGMGIATGVDLARTGGGHQRHQPPDRSAGAVSRVAAAINAKRAVPVGWAKQSEPTMAAEHYGEQH